MTKKRKRWVLGESFLADLSGVLEGSGAPEGTVYFEDISGEKLDSRKKYRLILEELP